jgi:hypothetical protein
MQEDPTMTMGTTIATEGHTIVVRRRTLHAVASALVLVLAVATPMAGATRKAEPSPLRAGNLLRVKDIAANGNTGRGQVVAIGWREASKPGRLYLAFSRDGGKDYRRTNGRLRKYPVVGDPRRGISLAICAKRIWAATAYRRPSDRPGDADVLLTSRTIGGGAAQALMTSTTADRRVRDVSISCVGNQYIAVGWLNRNGNGKTTARVMVRSLEPLGTPPTFKRIFNLGVAEFGSGLDVAATPALVAVAFVRDGDLRLKRFEVDRTAPGAITGEALKTIVRRDVEHPRMAAKSRRLVVAYTDRGKLRAKVSGDLGETLSSPVTLARTGGLRNPSLADSVDVVGDRIVATARVYSQATGYKPQRISSADFGNSWSARTFGNVGARVAALLKKQGRDPLLVEAWHNNAPKGLADTLRARYELP